MMIRTVKGAYTDTTYITFDDDDKRLLLAIVAILHGSTTLLDGALAIVAGPTAPKSSAEGAEP